MGRAEETLTFKEGYEAMLYLLKNYWELTGSRDLTDILSGGEYLIDGQPADSAFLEYWLDAIDQVKKNGPPPPKMLCK